MARVPGSWRGKQVPHRLGRGIVAALELPGRLLRPPDLAGLWPVTVALGGALCVGALLWRAVVEHHRVGPAGAAAAVACWVGVGLACRSPRAGLGLSYAGVAGTALLGAPITPLWLGLLVNLFFLALLRPTGEAFLLTVGAVALGLLVAHAASVVPFTWTTVSQLGWFFAAGAAGAAVRSQRRYTAQALGRAAWAERIQEQEARQRVADERLRIAAELHDAVGHGIALINIQAGVASQLLDRDPEAARTALTRICDAAGDALAEMRATLGLLRDSTGQPAGPQLPRGDVTTLVEDARAAGLPVHLTVTGKAPELPAVLRSTAYRVVQESLTNAVKYATGMTELRVALRYAPRALDVDVVDDGATTPAPAGPGPGGQGLRSMAERVRAVGGELRAGPEPGGGFAVHAHLPLRVSL
jgi:signal transduction histidine kinase